MSLASERKAASPRSSLDVSDLPREVWDPLHAPRALDGTWTTCNIGEALPGVPTPLGWAIWCVPAQQSVLNAFYAIGALKRSETRLSPDPDDQFIWAFYGRGAINVDVMAGFADRIPGTSGPALAEQWLGRCPEHLVAHPVYRRYPVSAVKLGALFATIGKKVSRAAKETDDWYKASIARVAHLDEREATALFAEAYKSFGDNVTVQGLSLFGVIPAVFAQIMTIAAKAGVDGTAIMGGYGSHAETEIVNDLWAAGRGTLPFDELVARHGYHGPLEGEMSARVWREDPEPLRKIVEDYAKLPDSRNPALLATELVERRQALEAELLQKLPRHQRAAGRLILAAARTYIPMRGTAKVSFLQSIDVARASARRLGALLHDNGTLDDAEDIFYLTCDEIIAGPRDVRGLVKLRRERRARFQELDVPGNWHAMPEPYLVAAPAAQDGPSHGPVSGIGASAGVVEGTVRVVLDPNFADLEGDEILVAPFTDPSWAAVLYLAKALVVDIGAALSHAAIVARELGIPCVVNTGDGTKRLKTGDRVRVDGTAGTVEILG
jgi:pyruvate,water dikinase